MVSVVDNSGHLCQRLTKYAPAPTISRMNREHNISEAARIVGVTRQRLHQLIRAGHGPECAYPSPRHPIIMDRDLRRWMRTRKPVNGRPRTRARHP